MTLRILLYLGAALICTISTAVLAQTSNYSSVDVSTINECKQFTSQHPFDADGWLRLAGTYEKTGNIKDAIDTCRFIAQRFPKHRNLLAHVGALQANIGDTEGAIISLRNAIDTNPEDAESYLTLSTLYSQLGNLDEQMAVEKQFLEKFPEHPYAAQMTDRINYHQSEYKKLQSQASNAGPTFEETYHRWPATSMPLKVWVQDNFRDQSLWQPSGAAEEIVEGSPGALVERACNEWSAASGGRLSFLMTQSRDQANIECVPTDDAGALHATYAAGETSMVNRNGKTKQIVNILSVDKSTGKIVDKATFYETTLHEVGHAIGLEHSKNVQDIMYPTQHHPPLAMLSSNDRTRVIHLYTR